MSLTYFIVHRTINRVRVRVPALCRLPFLQDHIASCLSEQKCVTKVRVNLSARCIVVDYDSKIGRPNLLTIGLLSANPKDYQNADNSKNNQTGEQSAQNEDGDSKKNLIVSSIALGASTVLPFQPFIIAPLTLYSSIPIIKRAFRSIIKDKRISVDVLDAVAVITMVIRKSTLPAAFMTWLIAVGDYIRDRTVEKTRKAVSDLMNYKKQKAWALRENKKQRVSIDELIEGDIIIAYTGNMIAADGVVITGKALVDQKTLTGESMPVEKKAGDKVFASTLVCEGKLYIKAESVGDTTRAAAIVRIVENAPKHETRIANYARVFADKVAGPTLALSGGMYYLTRNIDRATSLVILDFGTGMRVAAPTAAISSIAAAARKGILIKGGAQLEKMSQLDTLIFDKTGTLTIGNPEITEVYQFNGYTENEILLYAAAAEARITHPVAKAICRAAKSRGLHIPERDESEYTIGMGVKVNVNGKCVHAGSSRYFEFEGIECKGSNINDINLKYAEKAPVFVAVDGKLVGMLIYNDPPRKEAFRVIQELKNRNINVVMLSGDIPSAAEYVAKQLGIDNYIAEVFPEKKAAIVQEYQQKGHIVGMIGDGINDSPALALADVGFSVRNGAEVSREVADVVLQHDDLNLLINAIDISHNAMTLIKQDFACIALPNLIALGLALTGRLNPILATIVNNGSTVAAVLNSIRPLLTLNQSFNQSSEGLLSNSAHNHSENFLADSSAHFREQICSA